MSSSPELAEIVERLTPLAHKFFELGTQLKIDYHQLKIIENEHKSDLSRCLIETIRLWQNESDDECSWSVLAAAVERVPGHKRQARELRELDVGTKDLIQEDRKLRKKRVPEPNTPRRLSDDTEYPPKGIP